MSGDFHYRDPMIFDLETDGGIQIIQIGALAPLSNKVFEVKIKFNMKRANKEVLELNSYEKEAWEREAVSPFRARTLFNRFIRKHSCLRKISKEKGTPYRVAAGMGYNAHKFDMPLLLDWYRRHDTFLAIDFRVFDVMHLAMWALPDLENYTLSAVSEHLGVLREGAHDAVIDCQMTADVAAVLLHKCGHRERWVKRRIRQIARRAQKTRS